MKFAHISDLHLGRKVDEGTRWEKRATQSLFDGLVNLHRMIDSSRLSLLNGCS